MSARSHTVTARERSDAKEFYAVLDQVVALLRQRGRVSYRRLKRAFQLDDAYLEHELISAQ
jgi:hypothetical protein